MKHSWSNSEYYCHLYWAHALIRRYLTTGRKHALNKHVRLLTRLYSIVLNYIGSLTVEWVNHLRWHWLNKIEGWSRDGRVKKYTNKICSWDNLSHPLYIPTLAFSILTCTTDSLCKCRYTLFLTLCTWEKSKGSQCWLSIPACAPYS